MAEQTNDVDVQALMILLTRVNQTTLEVLVTLLEAEANKLPTSLLRSLADQFDWVSRVIRGQLPPVAPDGAA